MNIQRTACNFDYKPGYSFHASAETNPPLVMLQMITPPMPLIGTEVCAPITVSKLVPAYVLGYTDEQAWELFLGLAVFWERHEMDEWLFQDVADSEHAADYVDDRLAHMNVAQLRAHAQWFKQAPRPVHRMDFNISVGKVRL